jgi:small-conductance mechanosensitive channel
MIYFNETYCLIRDIGLRSTKIYDIVNHVIIIIPNNSLANQNILNLTRPDRYYRIRVEVGVSYDSDPDQVEKLLLEVAEQNSDVEQDDPTRMPLVRFQDFGDSSLTFILVAWINNVIKIRQINSDLHHQVFDKLKGAGVTIAFPQRDVHIHEVPEPAITKSPKPAATKSPKTAAKKSPKTAAKKSPKRAAKKKK